VAKGVRGGRPYNGAYGSLYGLLIWKGKDCSEKERDKKEWAKKDRGKEGAVSETAGWGWNVERKKEH